MNNPLSVFLPKDLLIHFDIVLVHELGEISTKQHIYHIHLTGKNVLPTGYNRTEYESKGFYLDKTIQDFPVRGKGVYLVINRRRWRNKESKKDIKSDYSFIAVGSKLTQELADFLKGTN